MYFSSEAKAANPLMKMGPQLLATALGTSFTARGDWSPVLTALQTVHQRPVRFVNAGKGGANSRYGTKIAASLADMRPDFVLVEFAINDADIRAPMSLNESELNMRAIFDKFLTIIGRSRIFLVLTPGPSGLKAALRPLLQLYDERHAEIAASEGLTIVDIRRALHSLSGSARRLIRPDGVHLTHEGFSTFAAPEIGAAMAQT